MTEKEYQKDEDTTKIYYCIKDGKFLWGTKRIENADFEMIELSNYKKLNSLIKEKGLSKEDLTLILKTIRLHDVDLKKINRIELKVDLKGIDENVKKTQYFVELLKEAKSLADDLASINFDIGFKI